MLLKGQLAKLTVLVEPNLYRDYVTYYTSGVNMLYLHMQKALYGMLESALALYKLLRQKLEDEGFEVTVRCKIVCNKIFKTDF